jgi:ubiquitin fusion degradation protein 1
MMNTLLLSEGSLLNLKSTALSLGKFIKIQPQSPSFLSIHDPKAVLEMSLRNFTALTTGDIIQIKYNNTIYEIAVLETKSQDPSAEVSAVCVIETDIEVDFAPPVGYIEPSKSTGSSRPSSSRTPGLPNDVVVVPVHGGLSSKLDFQALSSAPDAASESAFSRGGQSLRGLRIPSSPLASLDNESGSIPPRAPGFFHGGPPPRPFRVPFGVFFVGYPVIPVKNVEEVEEDKGAFKGQGVRLKDAVKGRKKKNGSERGTNSSNPIQLD